MSYSFKPEEVVVQSWSRKAISGFSLSNVVGVKVTHIKTGIVVICDSERSQHRNRHLAFIELEKKLEQKMKLNDYQLQAMKYAKFASLDYPFAGLAEEAGEVMGKLAKAARKNGTCIEDVLSAPSSDLIKSLSKELGDVLWMVQACAHNLGLTLEEIAQDNIEKLADRDARGVICGSGDNR